MAVALYLSQSIEHHNHWFRGLGTHLAARLDPADNGPDQDTVDQLGFRVYRALEHYGAIKPPGQQAARQ